MLKKSITIISAMIFAISVVILLATALSANAAPMAASSIMWTDDFSSSSLDGHWSWIREVPTHWSLSAMPGFLRITTQRTFSNFNNILVRNLPVGNYEIQTRVNFTPTENYQIAGLLIYEDDNNFLILGRAYCDTPPPDCVGNGIYYDYVEAGTFIGNNFSMTTTSQGVAYLKLIR